MSRAVPADFAVTLAHSLSSDQHQQHFPVCSLGWHQHRGDAGRGEGNIKCLKNEELAVMEEGKALGKEMNSCFIQMGAGEKSEFKKGKAHTHHK